MQLKADALKKIESPGDGVKHVFISFAYEDLNEINLLRGQARNENTELEFDDHSVKDAYNSANAEYIKSKIREKIDRVSVTLVYLSANAATSQWVNWEIEESARRGKGVVGVYKGDVAPSVTPSAFKKGGYGMVRWSHEALTKAVNDASRSR
ncbi:MAG: TIR domain-containing protein [Polaromonas sp.]|uniref:TIR domain-containing protein n=1 Tax=Polaromonas sp. TaxID=1869339 RepID=UPI0024877626|nr:TIR domain-containing protein [Polaromonas sp.]MDI1267555.1 TIR domain-containing protein [Polaromonas sp.]